MLLDGIGRYWVLLCSHELKFAVRIGVTKTGDGDARWDDGERGILVLSEEVEVDKRVSAQDWG